MRDPASTYGKTLCEFSVAQGTYEIAKPLACLWATGNAKQKSQAALGEILLELLSDMGSIPITFTTHKDLQA